MSDDILYYDSIEDEVPGQEKDEDRLTSSNKVVPGFFFQRYPDREISIGTMPANEPIDVTIDPSTPEQLSYYTIPEGYHYGTGRVIAKDVADFTEGDAVPMDLAMGKIAWVNGERLVGEFDVESYVEQWLAETNALKSQVASGVKFYSSEYPGEISEGEMTTIQPEYTVLNCGQSISILEGYHTGSGVVAAADLASQTPGTANENTILNGYTAWVNGELKTGTLSPMEPVSETVRCDETYIVPAGLHDGTGTVTGASLASQTPATATAEQMLDGSTAWVNGQLKTGSIPIITPVSATVNCDESYPIPAGYHDGTGTVTGASLASQTPGTADEHKILNGYTAWVNGELKTGDVATAPHVSEEVDCGETYTIPAGLHDGTGTVTGASLASQTQATATAEQMLDGATAWVNGELKTGSVPIITPVSKTVNCDEQYSIPEGYHDGTGSVTGASLAAQTQASADEHKILNGYTAWVNGELKTGDLSPMEPVSKTVNCGETYIVPAGLHDGTGTVTGASLASQTPGTADEHKILNGYTAWVNGQLKTGDVATAPRVSEEVDCGEIYTIPAGLHDGTGTVTGASLASQTQATADEYKILDGYTAWVNGQLKTGEVQIITPVSKTINCDEIYSIEEGYHDGTEVITGSSLADQTQGTATANVILNGYTAWVNGELKTGSLSPMSPVSETVDCGETYTIPAGLHDGTGTVTGASLASQTQGTADEHKILNGYTAWVNGELKTGDVATVSPVSVTVDCEEVYTIPAGLHDGTGTVTGASLSSQTQGTADGSKMLDGETAWVNGVQITGNIPTRTGTSTVLLAGGQITIQAGYYPTSFTISAADLASQTAGTAGPGDIVEGETAWVNGVQITGELENADSTEF